MREIIFAAVEFKMMSTMVVDFHVLPWFLRPRMTVQTHCRYPDAARPHPLAISSSTTSFLTKTADSQFCSRDWALLLRQPHVDSHSVHCPITSKTTLGVLLARGCSSRRLIASVGGRPVEKICAAAAVGYTVSQNGSSFSHATLVSAA